MGNQHPLAMGACCYQTVLTTSSTSRRSANSVVSSSRKSRRRTRREILRSTTSVVRPNTFPSPASNLAVTATTGGNRHTNDCQHNFTCTTTTTATGRQQQQQQQHHHRRLYDDITAASSVSSIGSVFNNININSMEDHHPPQRFIMHTNMTIAIDPRKNRRECRTERPIKRRGSYRCEREEIDENREEIEE